MHKDKSTATGPSYRPKYARAAFGRARKIRATLSLGFVGLAVALVFVAIAEPRPPTTADLNLIYANNKNLTEGEKKSLLESYLEGSSTTLRHDRCCCSSVDTTWNIYDDRLYQCVDGELRMKIAGPP